MKQSRKFISDADAKEAASWWNAIPGGKKRYYKEHSKLTTPEKVARYWLANVKDMASVQSRQAATFAPHLSASITTPNT